MQKKNVLETFNKRVDCFMMINEPVVKSLLKLRIGNKKVDRNNGEWAPRNSFDAKSEPDIEPWTNLIKDNF
jgi:hypothetical protein